MFQPEDIQKRLREKPFHPFRIIADEGLRCDIPHPDLVLVGQRDIMVGHATPERPTIYDSVTRVALLHIVALEELATTPSTSNAPG